jgi:hypothetical protein
MVNIFPKKDTDYFCKRSCQTDIKITVKDKSTVKKLLSTKSYSIADQQTKYIVRVKFPRPLNRDSKY